MDLEDLKVYQLAMLIGESCWTVVAKWDNFQKDTIGKQLVRSADSIAANISEGFGRYHYKENKNFNFYARGSLFETRTWLVKAQTRKLISETDFLKMKKDMSDLGYLINRYIKSIGSDQKLTEPEVEYGKNLSEDFFDLESIPFPDEKIIISLNDCFNDCF